MSDIPTDFILDDKAPGTGAVLRRSVLVVDDDADFAESLVGLLQMEGYEASLARNAEAAEAVLRERRIAVALIDLRLDLGSGVDLIRSLHQSAPDLVTVMITAYASIETAIEAMKAGAYDYLSKPFYTEDLLATLDRCFERIRLVEERRRAEDRLRQLQRMEAIGQLTSGLAHDFNNVLSVLVGNLHWMRERLGDEPALHEMVDDALDAARAGSEMTERLLAFGRQSTSETKPTDLGEALPAFARVLGRTLGDAVTIDLEVAPGTDPIEIDRSQLESSLLNLALNARDAMPEGGGLRFEAANLVIGPEDSRVASGLRPGPYVLLSVIDSGLGMPAAIQRRALEPFFTTKPPGYGSGLGLTMVDGFVRQAGGRLGLTSAAGEGTRVNLYFPALTARRPAPSSSEGGANM
ncbi:response regulator [Taklimakanibacter deserti]|uniref:response regulator n=1 Tax=Taklimakanibacter deserti TaxID=2267839 RepID=UPI000E654EAB